MRAIIDQTGHPEAVEYYRAFPREVSRQRQDDMQITIQDPIPNITMEKVLDQLLVAAALHETVVLIVAHGRDDGLIMPIATGGSSSRRTELQRVIDAGNALRRRDAIRRRPEAARTAEWTRFLRELAPDRVRGRVTADEAERWFQTWVERHARGVGVNQAKLVQLVDKMNRVRRANFARIEIRACNMGTDPAALGTLREFLGARRLCAPNVRTFYVGVIPLITQSARQRAAWARRYAGPVRGGLYRGPRGPRSRTYTVYVPARGNVPQGFAIPQGFTIRVWEERQGPRGRRRRQFVAHAAASDRAHVRAWVNHNIMPRSGYRQGRFVLAGMWTFGPGREPFVTPEEPEYRQTIVCIRAPQAAAGGP